MGFRFNCCAVFLTAALASGALGAGCNVGKITAPGYVPPGQDGGPPVGQTPEEIFNGQVLPLMTGCRDCHVTGLMGAPAFLADGDVYPQVRMLVVPGEAGSSLLLVKGAHRGAPWFDAAGEATITQWIVAEGDVDPDPGGPLESGRIVVVEGANQIALDSLGLVGSSIAFTAMTTPLGLRLSELMLHGGTGGAAVSLPRFVVYEGGVGTPNEDAITTVDQRVDAGEASELALAYVLMDFEVGDQLSIRFAAASTRD